ncbi:hypothetical protein PV11_07021 [Exophiala sideris]|uniref:FAD/NAD(P)-binding domain-containing protein n=1 Tax=Exophiala sideris TaxID=1016849 RepID=A0A0D1YF50_9EURO|nr:hypothetical protein PV11_07021 [Exophiala sideris]
MASNNFDVIIVGAGISGVNAAYRLQESLPDYSYAIFEGRAEMGGTWSLFKYPGIRSDSDLHTFGFPWDPWKEDRAIADAPSILKYVKTTAERHGIDKHVKYQHKVESMNWSSEQQQWRLEVTVEGAEMRTYYARHIMIGTGYYDYGQGLPARIPGIENFKGTVVHPQFWPEDLDYADKKVVIIGSGATAVTLLPSMAEKAESVTMLQRSPGYFLIVPLTFPVDKVLKAVLPEKWAYQLIRWRFMLLSLFFFHFCRLFPERGIKALRKTTEKELPPTLQFDKHFVPKYKPWEQRMCITPGGDFFAALRSGKGNMVTDIIENVTASGIQLQSGQYLDADIIVTATGLKMQIFGGIKVSVDGEPFNQGKKFIWRGALLQDLPNFTYVFGYTNASWTLGADATALLWVRLLKQMKKQNMTSMVARLDQKEGVVEVPLLNLSSTYIKSAAETGALPKAGDRGPWTPRSAYLWDFWHAKFGDISTGLQFYRVST